MQSIIGITKDKHKTLFKSEKKYERPQTPFVLGSAFMAQQQQGSKVKQLLSTVGTIPKIIHQTWKNEMLPSRWKEYFDGWSTYHPDFTHVLWTDSDNDRLVWDHYPEFVDSYNWFPLMIQKTDFVRLMYLHQYGGVYADLDYEVFDNILHHLPQTSGVMLVESPLTFTEITQNSLMIAEAKHPFLYSVLQLIDEIVKDMRDQQCTKYPFNNLYDNVLFGKMLHTLSTLFLTGPATLDKTFVRASLLQGGNSQVSGVRMLPFTTFYEGTVAKHHHNGSWFNGPQLLQVFFVIVAVTVLCIILACVLITYFSTKAALKKKG